VTGGTGLPDLASVAGHLARFLIRFGLGLAGAVCVVVALTAVDWRLGLLTAGVFFLALDWKVP